MRKPGVEVLAYTKAVNMRSRAVMERLGLLRDSARDYTYSDEHGGWPTMVWVALSGAL